MHIRKVQKLGSSLTLSIPKTIVESEQISLGDLMVIKLRGSNIEIQKLDVDKIAEDMKKR